MQQAIVQSCYGTRFSFPANSRTMEPGNDKELIEALIEWSGKSPSMLAKLANLTPSTLTRPISQEVNHKLSLQTLTKLRTTFPSFPGWGSTPDIPAVSPDRAYVSVRVLPSYAGMGGGGNGDGDQEYAMLPRNLIEDELRGRADDFELIDVRGDSMVPDFQHGDQILIDMRDRDPRQPGPFALFDGDGYVLKLVERVPQKRGWYRIFSANDRYSSYEIEETETTILGRPVWFARRL